MLASLWDYSPKRGPAPTAGRPSVGPPHRAEGTNGHLGPAQVHTVILDQLSVRLVILRQSCIELLLYFILYLHREHTSGLLRKVVHWERKLGTGGRLPAHTEVDLAKQGGSFLPNEKAFVRLEDPGN